MNRALSILPFEQKYASIREGISAKCPSTDVKWAFWIVSEEQLGILIFHDLSLIQTPKMLNGRLSYILPASRNGYLSLKKTVQCQYFDVIIYFSNL